MTDIALTTAGRVEIVESFEQATLPAAEAIVAGNAVRLDTSTGKFTKANGTTAPEARIYGIAVKSVAAGEPVTAIRRGVMDGFALAAVAYDAPIYLSDTDGAIADSTGTVSTIIGRVFPATSVTLGTGLDKLLLIHL